MMRWCVVALAILAAAFAHGQELRAWGEVVHAEPIRTSHNVLREQGDCNPARPDTDATLAELLGWDLRIDCTQVIDREERVDGYRVTYRWDGRTLETVMSEPPADRIALDIRID
jgi:hypothetical protein